jgi:hypothetical protein
MADGFFTNMMNGDMGKAFGGFGSGFGDLLFGNSQNSLGSGSLNNGISRITPGLTNGAMTPMNGVNNGASNWLSGNSAFGKNGSMGWLNGGANALGDLSKIYAGISQVNLGKDQLATQKSIFNQNEANKAKLYNQGQANLLAASPFAQTMSQKDKEDWLLNNSVNAGKV